MTLQKSTQSQLLEHIIYTRFDFTISIHYTTRKIKSF